MKKTVYILSAALLSITHAVAPQTPEPRGFPFFRSFMDGKTEGITFPSSGLGPIRQNSAALDAGSQGLRLTSRTSEVGAFYLPDHVFTTNDGLLIEFDYTMMFTNPSQMGSTDGICMYLVDVSYLGDDRQELRFGAEGAGFGYTHNGTLYTYSADRKRGILGSYVAIALDQGPFKTIRFEGNELRNGIAYGSVGSPAQNPYDVKNSAHDTRSNVTLRGAAGQVTQQIIVSGRSLISGAERSVTYTMTQGYWGFPVLATRNTEELRDQAAYTLNPANGTYTGNAASRRDILPEIATPFNIAGNAVVTDPDRPEYRKAAIKLEPNPDSSIGGFKITVTIQHGVEQTIVIRDFTYPASLVYQENGLYLDETNSHYPHATNLPVPVSLSVSVPSQLVIGFSASTGTAIPYTNIIRNLRITPAYGAATANDDIRGHRRGPAVIRPFDNDIGYNKESDGTITGSNEYLDPASFRFWVDESTPLGNNVFEHVADNGAWRYDPEVGEVMFFPDKGFADDTAWILYDIKAKADTSFSDEKYRSSLAVISVTVEDNQPELP